MIISAFLKLNTAGFTTGLGKAIEGIKFFGRNIAGLGDKIKGAYDFGGQIGDVAAQIGESAGEALVLRQAFIDTGVGGDALVQTLAIMRRNLADLSGAGTKSETLGKLGLDVKALMDMGAADQLHAIGDSINAISDPSSKSAAAMEIFGRSGAKMLSYFDAGDAIDVARDSLGSLPGIMDRSSDAFDTISDRLGRLKMKSIGLWAGIAEGLLPVVDQVTGMLDKVDVAAFGQKIGAVLGAVVELFRQFSIGDIFSASLDAGMNSFINNAIRGLLRLGNTIVRSMATPFAAISAAFQKIIEEALELIAKIPWLGEATGLTGFKADSYDDMFEEQLAGRKLNAELFDEWLDDKQFLEVSQKGRDVWKAAQEAFEKTLAGLQKGGTGGGRGGDGGGKGLNLGGAADGITPDRLARIGGYVGGIGLAPKMETLTQKIVDNTGQTNELLAQNARGMPVAAWG
jgi:hypothetical protein